jgi:hypothetical protein
MFWMAPSSSPRLQNVVPLAYPGAKAINGPVRANSRSRTGTLSTRRPIADVPSAAWPPNSVCLTRPFVLSSVTGAAMRV